MFYERSELFSNNMFMRMLVEVPINYIALTLLACFGLSFIYITTTNKVLKKTKIKLNIFDDEAKSELSNIIMFISIHLLIINMLVVYLSFYINTNYINKPIETSDYANYMKFDGDKLTSLDKNIIISSNTSDYRLKDCNITLKYDTDKRQGYLNIVKLNTPLKDNLVNHDQIYLNEDVYENLNKLKN